MANITSQARITTLLSIVGAFTVLLSACSPEAPSVKTEESAPTGVSTTISTTDALPDNFPIEHYRRAVATGHKVLAISPKHSILTIEVRRAGILARLGHDHAIASHNINGFIDLDAGRSDLYFPLATLTVDEPERRAEAGFSRQPDETAIAGTRRNMLTHVLQPERFPFVSINTRRIVTEGSDAAAADTVTLQSSISLHGIIKNYVIPAQIEIIPDGIAVHGSISVLQSDFGIIPFSTLHGALQVADRLDLHYRIVAQGQPGN